MSDARLISVAVERFKSHRDETCLKVGGLTVLVGRNNSGKSSIIQALLLLKQTLETPRLDVPLHLNGIVSAQSIRELTFGWPDGSKVEGPTFTLVWASAVNTRVARERFGNDSVDTMVARPELAWLRGFDSHDSLLTSTEIKLIYGEIERGLVLNEIRLKALDLDGSPRLELTFARNEEGEYECTWNGAIAKRLIVDLDHFIPYVSLDKRNVGPRDRHRALVNAYNLLFLQPLDDLRSMLKGFSFLSSARALPPPLYPFTSLAPDSVGVSGETAAEFLHANREEFVTFVPPAELNGRDIPTPLASSLESSVNSVLAQLGINETLKIEEIRDVGFRLLFGRAGIQHVGRGLTYLLPIIELGLVSDPNLFRRPKARAGTNDEITSTALCAFEEPEAHLHPKLQSKLAEWFVSLAFANRQVFVETHSDHLVRRLRSLVAQAEAGSEFESWFLKEVRIVEVEQDAGVSTVRVSSIDPKGSIESWPADFMDQATNVEEEIYFAALDKEGNQVMIQDGFVHHETGEP